ncbi:glycoside hydrolase family 88 protein [bacterium]|nr:glycoside hydrolase family 88 protein [bacterium]
MNSMKLSMFVMFFTVFFVLTEGVIAQNLPSADEVVEKMILANQYFMNKWPDPTVDIVTDKRRPSNIWTRATYYEGLMALYRVAPQKAYYDYAVDWGEGHRWRPAYGDTWTKNADNQCCGQTYIELYQIDSKSERIGSIKETIDRMVIDDNNDAWWWIDALQMAMPIFAKLGAIYQDSLYFNKMYNIYNYTKIQHGTNGLYNPEDHLWWRDKDFDSPYTAPNGEDTYWSRGNGWVLTALARVLDVMPKDAPHRDEYMTTFKEMAEALIPIQREDGFWNVSLHDPNDFGGRETSGTAFFTFGLAWGVNHGLLNEDKFKTAAIKGWNGLVNDALHDDGFLGYVQSTGKQPSDGQPVTYDKVPNFEDYGLGAFLLAGSEIYQMAGGTAQILLTSPCIQPVEVTLYAAFPNPLNPITTITYSLAETTLVDLTIYNTLGKKVFTFYQEEWQGTGHHQVIWRGINNDGRSVPSGNYIIQLKAGSAVQNQKITIIK